MHRNFFIHILPSTCYPHFVICILLFLFSLFRRSSCKFTLAVQLHTVKPTWQKNLSSAFFLRILTSRFCWPHFFIHISSSVFCSRIQLSSTFCHICILSFAFCHPHFFIRIFQPHLSSSFFHIQNYVSRKCLKRFSSRSFYS